MLKVIIDFFKKAPAKDMAQEDLEEAQRQYLKHMAAAAYHGKITEYYQESIQRLNMYIKRG